MCAKEKDYIFFKFVNLIEGYCLYVMGVTFNPPLKCEFNIGIKWWEIAREKDKNKACLDYFMMVIDARQAEFEKFPLLYKITKEHVKSAIENSEYYFVQE